MENISIAIVYHSNFGHTRQIAEVLGKSMSAPEVCVHVLSVHDAKEKMEVLNNADAIIFGSPTYFGNVSAEFKAFMESTGGIWFNQGWKNKLAAGFTNSSTRSGDKMLTLMALSAFAAQHGMIWISQGVMPQYENNTQTNGQNRLGSYLGLMAMSDNDLSRVNDIHPGDLLTIHLFAERIVQTVRAFKSHREVESL